MYLDSLAVISGVGVRSILQQLLRATVIKMWNSHELGLNRCGFNYFLAAASKINHLPI